VQVQSKHESTAATRQPSTRPHGHSKYHELTQPYKLTIHAAPLEERNAGDQTEKGLKHSLWGRVHDNTAVLRILIEFQLVANDEWDIYNWLTQDAEGENRITTIQHSLKGGAVLTLHSTIEQAETFRRSITTPDIVAFTATFCTGLRDLGTLQTELKEPQTNVKVCATLGELQSKLWYTTRIGTVFCPWARSGEHKPQQNLNVYIRLVNEFTLQDLDDIPIAKRAENIEALGLRPLDLRLCNHLDREEAHLEAQLSRQTENQATCFPPPETSARNPVYANLARSVLSRSTTEERPRKRHCVSFNPDVQTETGFAKCKGASPILASITEIPVIPVPLEPPADWNPGTESPWGEEYFSGFPGHISEDSELEALIGENNPENSTARLDLRTLVSPTGCISPTTDQCEPLPDLGLAELDEIDFPDFSSSSEEEQDPPSDDGSELDSDYCDELLAEGSPDDESSDDELWIISSDEELPLENDNPLEWNGGTDEDYLDWLTRIPTEHLHLLPDPPPGLTAQQWVDWHSTFPEKGGD